MKYLPYNTKHKMLSRYLRKNSTLSEVLLWNELKSAQMMGYTFNRQKPLLNYIVDFYCKPLELVIEIDGSSHTDENRDDLKQKNLEKLGLHVMRFLDIDVKTNMKNVIDTVELYILDFEASHPARPDYLKKSRPK